MIKIKINFPVFTIPLCFICGWAFMLYMVIGEDYREGRRFEKFVKENPKTKFVYDSHWSKADIKNPFKNKTDAKNVVVCELKDGYVSFSYSTCDNRRKSEKIKYFIKKAVPFDPKTNEIIDY